MYSDSNSITLLFCIKNISNLFIYKDHWTDNKVMRLVIKEILLSGQFDTHYLGSNHKATFRNLAATCSEAAIITVTICDLQFSDLEPAEIISIFSEELGNRKNRFLFENNMLDEEKNVTNINITIQLTSLRRQSLNENYQAA